MSKIKEMDNQTLLNEMLSLYSGDVGYEQYFDSKDMILFNDAGKEYAGKLKEELLSRMIDSNDERFQLFGVIDKSKGKLVSDLTNPRHKYWESEKRAQSAVDGYNPTYIHQRRRQKRDKDNLKVVTIDCIVRSISNE